MPAPGVRWLRPVSYTHLDVYKRQDLPNGYTVEYSKTDTSLYLMSILKSIFDHDKYVRRIIVGLSARNIRRAMEIFLEFCTSGHIKEDQIFKIRRSEGKYTLPLYQVSRVLLRMNRRFYDGDASVSYTHLI